MEKRSSTSSASLSSVSSESSSHSHPPQSKKRKTENREQWPPEFVFISCFDEPERLVEVPSRILAEFDCRLWGVIKHQEPEVQNTSRVRFWRCGMTRMMFTTFVRSLVQGQLSLGKGVSIAEAMTTFEYENVPIGVPVDKTGEVKLLRMPSSGVVFQKQPSLISEVVLRTSEQIAHTIARWPRLEANLNSALAGAPSMITCTATRAWVRFCRKPQLYYDKNETMASVARKWPNWASTLVTTLGILHTRLVRDGVIDEKARDAESFEALQSAVFGEPLGFFFAAVHDWPRSMMEGAVRKEFYKGEKFANEMRNCVIEASTSSSAVTGASSNMVVASKDPPPTPAAVYARSCISLADALVHDAPSPAVIYAGNCCDEHGKSPERIQLAKSLANRGIKVVKWCDDDRGPNKPLMFPPSWSDGPGSGGSQCAVLLDFSDKK